jgi:hypothetical protein
VRAKVALFQATGNVAAQLPALQAQQSGKHSHEACGLGNGLAPCAILSAAPMPISSAPVTQTSTAVGPAQPLQLPAGTSEVDAKLKRAEARRKEEENRRAAAVAQVGTVDILEGRQGRRKWRTTSDQHGRKGRSQGRI